MKRHLKHNGTPLLRRHHRLLKPKLIRRVLAFLVIPLLLLGSGWLPEAAVFAKVTPKHYKDLSFPPLKDINIPDYKRVQLDNGLIVYLMEDHELPVISGRLMVRTGSRLEPSEKTSMAAMMSEVMRSGGTLHHDADTLNQTLEQRAAAVEVGMGHTFASGSFTALTEDINDVLGLMAEVVREPAFPQDKIDLAKKQRRGGIARRNDNASSISSREFGKLIYGDDSPYARTLEYEHLDNITRADLVEFHQRYFHPNCTIMGIIGDFETDEMLALVKEKFGDWPMKPGIVEPTIPSATQVVTDGVFLVDQPQLTQSTVQIGHLGGQLNDPDIFALFVLNKALNSFGGRLFNEVRSRQGLAYSVYGVWSARYDYPGMFIAGGQTKSESTVPFIKAVLKELDKVRQEPLTEQELYRAKEAILNSFVFNFSDPAQTLSRLMRYEYHGYPEDFLFQYQRSVKTMTAAQVQRAAQTHLQPDQLVTLVVGNAQDLKPALAELDPNVTPIDITIPEPEPSS